ncbi:unnamed protein product [Notodromas monacha]|uniref:Sialidase domain-containing protein n=1 Tax=Notodromas monacha TaxID=399045 RepID=A0A7R9BR52_9CRUS|nr:unnamed protein product [Notodromas monacha]CAG0918799.1 unnamed protein product [Notodromas monacha]
MAQTPPTKPTENPDATHRLQRTTMGEGTMVGDVDSRVCWVRRCSQSMNLIRCLVLCSFIWTTCAADQNVEAYSIASQRSDNNIDRRTYNVPLSEVRYQGPYGDQQRLPNSIQATEEIMENPFIANGTVRQHRYRSTDQEYSGAFQRKTSEDITDISSSNTAPDDENLPENNVKNPAQGTPRAPKRQPLPKPKMSQSNGVAKRLNIKSKQAKQLRYTGPVPKHQIVFVKGLRGYHFFRKPAIVRTPTGSLLAFAEARRRKDSFSDVMILMRRSLDQGKTWSKAAKLVKAKKNQTFFSPAPVVDMRNGVVSVLFTLRDVVPKKVNDKIEQRPRQSVWVIRSTNDGTSWTALKEITRSVHKKPQEEYYTGPGHGIQLKSGRLLVPCYTMNKNAKKRTFRAHVVFSDDGGISWKRGGNSAVGTGESSAAQLPDGSVVLNSRQGMGKQKRYLAYSKNGGLSFQRGMFHSQLPEEMNGSPASTLNVAAGKRNALVLLQSHKKNLTLRVSSNKGQTWKLWRNIGPGWSSHVDLAFTKLGYLAAVFEAKQETIGFTSFPPDWKI